jgi:hypothetical protein
VPSRIASLSLIRCLHWKEPNQLINKLSSQYSSRKGYQFLVILLVALSLITLATMLPISESFNIELRWSKIFSKNPYIMFICTQMTRVTWRVTQFPVTARQ